MKRRKPNGRANGHGTPRRKPRARRSRRVTRALQLFDRIARLDPLAADAAVDVLDMVRELDKPRSLRLLEAVSTLVTFAARERSTP